MILEVKKFPESQEVMDDPEWFLIMDADPNDNKLGHGSYARIIYDGEVGDLYEKMFKEDEEEEVEIVFETNLNGHESESTKPDDCMITYQDPGDENE